MANNNSCALATTKTYFFLKMTNYRGFEHRMARLVWSLLLSSQVSLRWRQQHSWHISSEYCFWFDLNARRLATIGMVAVGRRLAANGKDYGRKMRKFVTFLVWPFRSCRACVTHVLFIFIRQQPAACGRFFVCTKRNLFATKTTVQFIFYF